MKSLHKKIWYNIRNTFVIEEQIKEEINDTIRHTIRHKMVCGTKNIVFNMVDRSALRVYASLFT